MDDNRPWLKNYPNGIPANINVDKYNNLNEYLDEVFNTYKSRIAFSCMGKEISFSQVDKLSRQFAGYMISRGLEPGDKVALMMPNLLQYPIAIFGCIKAGLIVVNTNPLYTTREMLHQFTDSDVKAIVIAENFASKLEQILPETKIKVVIATSIGSMLGPIKKHIVNFVVRRIKRMVPKYSIPNIVTFGEALKMGKRFSLKEFDDGPDRVIIHQYTGGTTGVAKGAMLTNRNIISNMLQINAVLLTNFKEGEEIALSPLPMYHIFAFTVNCLATMKIGAICVMVVNARDLSSIIKEFKRYKITLMTGVNTLFNALLHNKEFKDLDFSSLRITVGGGMAVQKVVATEWEKVTNCTLCEGYGMTEAAPVITVNPVDGGARIGSIGMPVPSTNVRIVDDQGKVLGVGEVGEIQMSGPQIMKGYYNKPEETAKVIVDGWLCTGDIGKMDADGFFYIVDRKKDMIIVSGFNVYPNEIEDVVSMHEKVREVAAIGIDHEKSGEVVKLFVVKKDKSLTKDELIEYCRENMTGYKVPKEIEFRKDLPKTNVGKILRRVLKEEEKNK
jgi:long-chain acyl-CoA synthetase